MNSVLITAIICFTLITITVIGRIKEKRVREIANEEIDKILESFAGCFK